MLEKGECSAPQRRRNYIRYEYVLLSICLSMVDRFGTHKKGIQVTFSSAEARMLR